jgi:hypothetical protein
MREKRLVGGKRIAAIALGIAVALGVATAIGVPLERAAVSSATSTTAGSTAATPTVQHKPQPLAMGSYPASEYAAAAAKLPKGLVIAVSRDVHLTAAQYLADAAAEEHAVKVVASLKTAGVHVLGSKMVGAKLVVNVASASQVRTVVATGATAVVGAPKTPDLSKQTFHSVSSTNIYGGEGYFFYSTPGQNSGAGDGDLCSIGFNGYSVATGAAQFVTAGHCATVIPDGNSVFLRVQTTSGVYKNTVSLGAAIGTAVPDEADYGGTKGDFAHEDDYGIVSEGDSGVVANGSVATWGGNSGSSPSTKAPTASTPLGITGETAAMDGATLCKSGSTTGWTCGKIEAVDSEVLVSGQYVNTIVATTCLIPGDSGGGAVIGTEAVGIDSGSDFPQTFTSASKACANPESKPSDGAADDPGYQSVFFPMVSADAGYASVQSEQGANWQLGLTVSAPKVTSPASGANAFTTGNFKGTLANPNPASMVSLYLDGSHTATSTVSASGGSWSFPLSSVTAGKHTYSLVATSGYSKSIATTGTIVVLVPITTAVTGGVGDFNGDGNSDIMARDANGALWLYPGTGSGHLSARVQITATGTANWKSMTALVSVGDLTGDGHPDLVARDSVGTLWLYPWASSHTLSAGVQLGDPGAFAGMTAIQGVADFTGDGHADIVTRDSSGKVWLYPFTGDAVMGAPVQIDVGWQTKTSIVGVGDFNGDGNSDLLVRDSSGALWLYPGTGSGTLGSRMQLGSGWQGYSIVAVGDFNHDGYLDIVGRDSVGRLWLYRGTGVGGFQARVEFSSGWSGYTIAGDGSTIAPVVIS